MPIKSILHFAVSLFHILAFLPCGPFIHFSPSSLPPPPSLHYLSFILCRSTADNLCSHSWAQCLAAVCLSCCSFTVGFWGSYCFVPAQTLCLSTVKTLRASCLLQEKSVWHRQFKDRHKARQMPLSSFFGIYSFVGFSLCMLFFYVVKLWELVLSLLILVCACFSPSSHYVLCRLVCVATTVGCTNMVSLNRRWSSKYVH